MKKTISILLSFVLLLCTPFEFGVQTFAAELTTGSCGDGVTYSFDSESGTLTISKTGEGTGDMESEYLGTAGASPFHGNGNIKSVVINNGVKSIGQFTFYSNENLTTISFPESLESIAFYAVYNCENVSKITVDENNSVYDSRDNCNAVIYSESNCLVVGCYNTVIPKTVTSIGSQAFDHCSRLTAIKIPDSVTTIERMAFNYCKNLKSIEIGTGLSTVKNWVFEDCSALTDVYYSGTTEQWGKIDIDSSRNESFLNAEIHCSDGVINEKNTVVVDGVTYSKDMTELVKYPEEKEETEFVVPSTVVTIKSKAFYNCKNLQKVSIPETVSVIDDDAFDLSEGVTILCSYGSAAQKYASKKNISCSTIVISPIPNQTYTGKGITPPLTVKVDSKTLKLGTDYKVTYKNNVNAGTASVYVVGIGSYNMYSASAKFVIIKKAAATTKKTVPKPKATVIKKLKRGKKQIKISWKKQSAITGYQLQLATNKKFTKNKKTVNIGKAKTTSKTVKKLKSNKKYYVRIRTYKTVKGKKYYSKWSKAKTVKTK